MYRIGIILLFLLLFFISCSGVDPQYCWHCDCPPEVENNSLICQDDFPTKVEYDNAALFLKEQGCDCEQKLEL